ncbi:DUF1056 family protein [Lactobacillus selangorensis]|uniref:DUF1056 family protein n=1 Tax=Lactobacillus selangorensis TaxID=81857 RepID=UPI000AF42C0D|nr:DUF1056 family protein [Lactobacillus selangorensis]
MVKQLKKMLLRGVIWVIDYLSTILFLSGLIIGNTAIFRHDSFFGSLTIAASLILVAFILDRANSGKGGDK